jgi:nicotinate (nicotinamide) nucleotide adenylyltransferase
MFEIDLQHKFMERKKQVAILGGAFDPVTKSHIELVNFVLNTSKWADEVWLCPCYQHMDGKKMAPVEHRLEMLRLASENDDRIKIFDYEIKHKLGGETYFMLYKLLNDPEYERYRFAFIIGIDRANSIYSWYNSDELLKLNVPFFVCPRKGFKKDEKINWYLNNHHMYLEEDNNPMSGFSSTMVRNIIGKIDKKEWGCGFENDNLKMMLDASVIEYIMKNNLYQK